MDQVDSHLFLVGGQHYFVPWYFWCSWSSSGSLVVMTSALHAEGREFNPRPEYSFLFLMEDPGDWSSGMIPALGAGGREFDSRITPFLPGQK